MFEDMVAGGQDEARCVRADVRLEADVSPQCSHMVDDNLNITYVFMYQPGVVIRMTVPVSVSYVTCSSLNADKLYHLRAKTSPGVFGWFGVPLVPS